MDRIPNQIGHADKACGIVGAALVTFAMTANLNTTQVKLITGLGIAILILGLAINQRTPPRPLPPVTPPAPPSLTKAQIDILEIFRQRLAAVSLALTLHFKGFHTQAEAKESINGIVVDLSNLATNIQHALDQEVDNRFADLLRDLQNEVRPLAMPVQEQFRSMDDLEASTVQRQDAIAKLGSSLLANIPPVPEVQNNVMTRAVYELFRFCERTPHPLDLIPGSTLLGASVRKRPLGKLAQMATARDQILTGVVKRLGLTAKVTYLPSGRVSFTTRQEVANELLQKLDPQLTCTNLQRLIGHLCVDASQPDVTDWEHRNAFMQYFNDLVHSDWWNVHAGSDERRQLCLIAAAIFEDVSLQEFSQKAILSIAARGGYRHDPDQGITERFVAMQKALDTVLRKDPEYCYGSELTTYDKADNDMGCGATLLRYNMPWCDGSYELSATRGRHQQVRVLRMGTPTQDYFDVDGTRKTRLIGPYLAYLEFLNEGEEKLFHVNLQKSVSPSSWWHAGSRALLGAVSPYGALVEPSHTQAFVDLDKQPGPNPYTMITLSMEEGLSNEWINATGAEHKDAFIDRFVALMMKPIGDRGECYFSDKSGQNLLTLKDYLKDQAGQVHNRRFGAKLMLDTADEKRELVIFTYAHLVLDFLEHTKSNVLQLHCKDGQDRRAILVAAMLIDQMVSERRLDDPCAQERLFANLFLPSYVNSARGIVKERFEALELVFRSTEAMQQRLSQEKPLRPFAWTPSKMSEQAMSAAGVNLTAHSANTPERYQTWLHFLGPVEISTDEWDNPEDLLNEVGQYFNPNRSHAFLVATFAQPNEKTVQLTVTNEAGKTRKYLIALTRSQREQQWIVTCSAPKLVP